MSEVDLSKAGRVTVLSGAGISTESGIPDFRGPQGVWTKDPAAEAMFTIDAYVADPAVRVAAWRNRRDHPAWTARPNAGHTALVDLERQGRLRAIVTQNIDGLHQAAGSSPGLVHEIHGTVWAVACLSCGRRQPMRAVLDRVEAGEEDPACTDCGGILKSATISFGQSLDADVLGACVEAARDCDLFLAVGTSLQVQPAASLCDIAQGSGARLVIVNGEHTPYDDLADTVVRDPIGQALPALLGDDIVVTVAHPFGDVEVPLSEWVRRGPGPRPQVRITAARRRSTGEQIPLDQIDDPWR